jgi:4-amino-4-deoxy-L-arabinose transferase-like glycosyltransferase
MNCQKRGAGFVTSAKCSRWLLTGVLVLALCFRLWGIDFGLPYLYHPDEPGIVGRAQRMFKTGDLHPHWFLYSSLVFYIHALSYAPYFFLGSWMGVFRVPTDVPFPNVIVLGCGVTPMPTTFLLGRLLTTVFGLGAVFLAYLIGWQLFDNRHVGLLAALMLAISPTNVGHSQFITPDTLLVFFLLLSVLGTVRVLREGQGRDYTLAGFAAGLAASAKYNGALIVLPLIAANLLRHGWKGTKKRGLYAALALSAVAFLLTTPFALLDLREFLAGIQLQGRIYSTGHAGMEGNALLWYLSYLLNREGPLVLLAALQILRGFSLRSRSIMLLSVFPVAYFAFISSFAVRNARTLLPLMPFLFLLAAGFLIEMFAWLCNLRSHKHTLLLLALAVLTLVLALPLWRSIEDGFRRTRVDSRETARTWISTALPPGAKIAVEAYSPYVSPRRFQVRGFAMIPDHPLDSYLAERFEYLVFSEGMFGRFYREPHRYAEEIRQYELFFNNLELVRIFVDGGYEVRVYRIPR